MENQTRDEKPVVVIVSGLSGSGKTTALRAFEDRGFFCIDNMPLPLIPQLVEETAPLIAQPPRIALGVDVRERALLHHFKEVRDKLLEMGCRFDLLFLEASEEVLIRRFSETRRMHPLMDEEKDIRRALYAEKRLLNEMRLGATIIIDSSALTVHQLKERIFHYIDTIAEERQLVVLVLSFGYKNGLPLEADLVFDLRFLPNPYFEPSLKDKTGLDQAVYDYVFSFPAAEQYYRKLRDLLYYTLPSFYSEGKAYLTVAFGCTGGQHRSVAFARRLFEDLNRYDEVALKVFCRHRDLDREKR